MNYDLCLHADSNDPAIIRLVLKNANNYLNGLSGEKFRLVVVANGPAVQRFTKAEDELFKMAEPLMAKGVEFKLCSNALRDNAIGEADIWPGAVIVPAGLVEVVRLQREGFAYIKP